MKKIDVFIFFQMGGTNELKKSELDKIDPYLAHCPSSSFDYFDLYLRSLNNAFVIPLRSGNKNDCNKEWPQRDLKKNP